MPRATPESIHAGATTQLERSLKLLLAFRNRLYRETGGFPDELAAAIHRVEFVLRDLFTGLVTPAKAKPAAIRPALSSTSTGQGKPN
jgi:hypothetical protein